RGLLAPSAPTPVAPGQWFTYCALSMPRWDPRNIDADAYISPSRARSDPNLPAGAQPEGRCMFQVMATVQTGPFISPHSASCDDVSPQRVPRCTLRGVWQQTIEYKTPSGNVVAQLDYFAPDKARPAQWFTSITGPAWSSSPARPAAASRRRSRRCSITSTAAAPATS
ncbi:MAG TPA: hypothetical protein VFS15_07895, partial [Kofleriaceae bacterium]|nr:hypothetical protein [Kofleriaceae bacterium]